LFPTRQFGIPDVSPAPFVTNFWSICCIFIAMANIFVDAILAKNFIPDVPDAMR
jgi:hypothetical protein